MRERQPGEMVCDFCSDWTAPATWVYPATPFTVTAAGIVSLSNDDWLVCEPCAELIELSSRVGLLNRCMNTFLLRRKVIDGNPVPSFERPMLEQAQRKVIEQFMSHRAGARRRFMQ